MSKIAIIIPSRLQAIRLPDKPLKTINNKEMIVHVLEVATKADMGDVIVATPDQKIVEVVKKNNGKAVITKFDHETGTDRIFEVFEKVLNKEPEIIINLQGDMPNLDPLSIKHLINHMEKKTCNIGTLASDLLKKEEIKNDNIVKVVTQKNIDKKDFSQAEDFFRISKYPLSNLVYHHIGIYAFTNEALIRYVNLKRSKLELERKLEQLRALENKMKIEVGYVKQCPLSIDTEEDLQEIKKLMEKNDKN